MHNRRLIQESAKHSRYAIYCSFAPMLTNVVELDAKISTLQCGICGIAALTYLRLQAMLTQSIDQFSRTSICRSSDETDSCVLFECKHQHGKLIGTASPPAKSPSPPRLSQAPITAPWPRLAQAPESLRLEMGLKMETSLRHSGTTLLAMAILTGWADVVTAAVFRREMLAQSGVFCRFCTMKRSFYHWQASLKKLQGV